MASEDVNKMAQKENTDITETSSDFSAFDRVKSSTTEIVEKEQDVRSLLADTEKIKDFISCRRCNNKFNKDCHRPFLLPCLDGICKMCMLDLQARGKTSYECAKCLTEHICLIKNVVTLQTDIIREFLSEICRLSNEEISLVCEMCTNHQTASHRCVDCSLFICTECVKLHGSLRQFKSHTVLEMKSLLTGSIEDLRLFFSTSSKQCSVTGHEKEYVKAFCSSPSCMKPVCFLCAVSTHKEHSVVDILQIRRERETKIQTQCKELQKKADLARISLTGLKNLDEKYVEKCQELQYNIKVYFSEAKKALKMREKKLLDAVTANMCNNSKMIDNETKRLMSLVNSCEQAFCYGKLCSEIVNVQSFLYVAESVQSRFKNLKDQLHESQASAETIEFSIEPSIPSFESTVNSLGKLSVSKALSSKSKAVITPSVCEVLQQVQFKIQLLSTFGKPIVDEDVHIWLEHNRKMFTILPCVFDKSSTSYFGSWIPEKPMQLAWIVVSNGIRMETLQGVLDVKRKTQKPSTNGMQILWSASGKISSEEKEFDGNRSKIKRKVEKHECVRQSTGKNGLGNKENLWQMNDMHDCLCNVEKESASYDYKALVNVTCIQVSMSRKEYLILRFFAKKRNWFKQYLDSFSYAETGLTCRVLTGDRQKIQEDIERHLEEVKMMTCISIEKKKEFSEPIKEVDENFPTVCLVVNDKSIDIISDSYEDAIKVQNIMTWTKRRRGRRTFANPDESEKTNLLSSSDVIYVGNTEGHYQTKLQPEVLEVKSTAGILIKIYAGSITRVNVDCIVNAANEQLMHGGGVAASISEAAGYHFDFESIQCVQEHGPIPVGSCCVTSAGKLPYKCVIHTVGPRWSDYRDSNLCLELLKQSVEFTFITADKKGMSSVAIPAISWGVFGVPRDMCVEQYYRATMSFCSTYPRKKLREIHFVDRDESVVKAIQEAFQRREPLGGTNV